MKRIMRQVMVEIVGRAISEDLGCGDVTTDSLTDPAWQGRAVFLVKSPGVIAGLDVVAEVFRQVDSELRFKASVKDGAKVKPGDEIAVVTGSVASILKAERTALNFLQRLSGVATETFRYVESIRGLKARILDTRKTTPGLRYLEKYAVMVGGGQNHRQNLGDGVLIKDNHLAMLRKQGVDLAGAVAKAREGAQITVKVEVEAEDLAGVKEAAEAGVDIIMLDNMDVKSMREAVRLINGRALVEASGGITLEEVRQVAETGVDFISVGALTHSVRALDISLELES